MANKKFSDLTATTSVASADIFAMENAGGNSRKITGTNISKGLRSLAFQGALVKKSADQTTANYTTETAIAWNAETYDTDAFHDTVTNNERLTIPSGVNYVRVWAHIRITLTADAEYHILGIRKNGNLAYDGCARQSGTFTGANSDITVSTAVIPVIAGDYFDAVLLIESDTSVTIAADRSSFGIEVVG